MEGFDLFCAGSIPVFLRSCKEMRGLVNLYVHFIIVTLRHSGTFPYVGVFLSGGEACIADWHAGVSET